MNSVQSDLNIEIVLRQLYGLHRRQFSCCAIVVLSTPFNGSSTSYSTMIIRFLCSTLCNDAEITALYRAVIAKLRALQFDKRVKTFISRCDSCNTTTVRVRCQPQRRRTQQRSARRRITSRDGWWCWQAWWRSRWTASQHYIEYRSKISVKSIAWTSMLCESYVSQCYRLLNDAVIMLSSYDVIFHWTVELLHPLTHLRSVSRHFSSIRHNRTVARAYGAI